MILHTSWSWRMKRGKGTSQVSLTALFQGGILKNGSSRSAIARHLFSDPQWTNRPNMGGTIMSQERSGVITFKGNSLTLIGPEIKVGDKAPNFVVIAKDLSPVTLESSRGKARLISVVPSLDTPVCDQQTRRFNEEAAKLPGNLEILTISMDLPFAQNRFCSTAGIGKV